MLRDYETIFVVNKDLEEDTRNATINRIKELIEDNGEIVEIDEWGMRKFAYEVDYQKEGYYVLANFKANPEFPEELKRVYRITDNIVKSIVVKKEA